MKRLTDVQKVEIVERYQNEKPGYAKLAKEYGVSPEAIGQLLKRRGVPQNRTRSEQHRKYTLNEHYFDIIDTEEKAYFLGLLYADGCNVERVGEIIISLQSADKHILEDFSRALETNKPFSFKENSKKNPKWSNIYGMSICSKIMSVRLTELGCVTAKSLILKFPTEDQVPSDLLRHFVRGYFDGDGSISVYKLPKQNRYQTITSFVSTLDFCTNLSNIIKNVLNINCRIYKRHKDRDTATRQMAISGNNTAVRVIEWMYEGATVFLQRKYEKYLKIKNDIQEVNLLPRWEEYAENQEIRIRPNGQALADLQNKRKTNRRNNGRQK